MFFYLFLSALFFLIMQSYIYIAGRLKIIDKPNERSSHRDVTIRGGGIIYLFAAVVALFLYPEMWMLVLGMFIIGTVSFVDDRITLSSKLRAFFQVLSVVLMTYALGIFNIVNWWAVILLIVVMIGVINAYNFMDGINGITGIYSLVVLIGLQYVNIQEKFISADLIWLPMLASLVFLFYNFRIKAKCFAGDVGSVTIAFWIVMLISQLIIVTGEFKYVFFLAVYGVDTIFTIVHRLTLKQNIFNAHRLHFYQILANERGISHLMIALGYGILQLLIIIFIIFFDLNVYYFFLIIQGILGVIYVILKPALMRT